MRNYLDLMNKIMTEGIDKDSRAGMTRSIFGAMMEWDLEKEFPIITTRKVSPRIAFEETWMFLRGETDTTTLEKKGINIWKGNTSREFLDDKGLYDLPVGSLGTGYSHQWRNFGGTKTEKGVDQIAELLDKLQKDPLSRRHIVTGWNPQQLDGAPLPPCHLYNQYAINEWRLDSSFMTRSQDFAFGNPFNVMGYAMLNIAIANFLGLKPGKLVYFGNDVHIYHNQFDMVKEQLSREPRPLPQIRLNTSIHDMKALMNLKYEDWELIGYDPHPDIKNKPPMAI